MQLSKSIIPSKFLMFVKHSDRLIISNFYFKSQIIIAEKTDMKFELQMTKSQIYII